MNLFKSTNLSYSHIEPHSNSIIIRIDENQKKDRIYIKKMETKLENRITVRLNTSHERMLNAIKSIIDDDAMSTSQLIRYLIESASNALGKIK